MPEKRKFAALAGIRQQQSPEESAESLAESVPAVVMNPVHGTGKGTRGRPTGKRSDPEFHPTTVLLRTQTKKAAVRKLEDTDTKKDLSDLIEQLLAGWVKRQA